MKWADETDYDEYDDDIETQPPCIACSGHGEILGQLGQLIWFRCRNCGITFNTEVEND